MYLKTTAIFTALALFPLFAGGPAHAAGIADDIVADARASCRDIHKGRFSMARGAIRRVDLTGDGKPETIVDSGRFRCSTAVGRFYCGSGGCLVTIIVKGRTFEFLTRGLKLAKRGKRHILLFAVHNRICGGQPAQPCYQARVWRNGAFRPSAP